MLILAKGIQPGDLLIDVRLNDGPVDVIALVIAVNSAMLTSSGWRLVELSVLKSGRVIDIDLDVDMLTTVSRPPRARACK